jgi:hypothetical protein
MALTQQDYSDEMHSWGSLPITLRLKHFGQEMERAKALGQTTKDKDPWTRERFRDVSVSPHKSPE